MASVTGSASSSARNATASLFPASNQAQTLPVMGENTRQGSGGQNALDQLNRLRQLVIQLRDAVQGTAVIDGGHGQDLPF